MKKPTHAAVKAAICRFESACEDAAWAGSHPPEQRDLIKQEKQLARENLELLIEQVRIG